MKKKLLGKRIKFSVIILFVLIVLITYQVRVDSQKFNMSYLSFGNSDTYLKYVDQTEGSLQVVSPSYIDINSDGTLNMEKLDSNFIKEMHKRNIKVVPFVSNHWNRMAGEIALEKREELSTQIANAVEEYGLDGVNVDIEGLTQDSRNDLTDFIRLVREKIPSKKEVSVAVAANPYGWTSGWQGMYDYTELSKLSNYLMIMTYDESWNGSNPGPVASISFVDKSIQYALDQEIPSDKIVLGIPFYGRIWNLEDTMDETKLEHQKILGKGVSLKKVDSILSTYNAKIEYVEDKESVKATFQIKQEDPQIKLYSWGEALPIGKYELWFENEKSIKKKLQFVQKYNIKGTGSWSLGQERPNLWEYYTLWLNGEYFVDLDNHKWAKEAIEVMTSKGIISGTSETTYSPELNINRADFMLLLARTFELEAEFETNFDDVKPTDYYYEALGIAKELGLASGVGSNKYNPKENISRQDMMVLLERALKLTNKISVKATPLDINNYKDSEAVSNYAEESVVTLVKAGIIQGNNNMLYPLDNTTRAEAAVVIYKVFNK
ncbi:MAG: glycoside hydrolase [Firmicutes bacterium]|nr:glycoside hydrolase [Bacillota bacterium]